MPSSIEETRPVAFRLPPSLIERLDAHAERMRRTIPGVQFTRTDALRVLLLRALDAEEAQAPPPPAPAPALNRRIAPTASRRPTSPAPAPARSATPAAAGQRKGAGPHKHGHRQK